MKEFNLTIFRETRVYISLGILPIWLIGSIVLAAELNSFIWVIILLITYIFLAYYYFVGHLTVIVENDELQFEWNKKFLFNYKNIEQIKFSEIKAIIIDENKCLRKIITNNKTVSINTGKIFTKDSAKFISYLMSISNEYNIQRLDSWDVVAEKGYLKLFYWISIVVCILAALAIIISIVIGKFSIKSSWLILFMIPQVIVATNQMRQKMKKKK